MRFNRDSVAHHLAEFGGRVKFRHAEKRLSNYPLVQPMWQVRQCSG